MKFLPKQKTVQNPRRTTTLRCDVSNQLQACWSRDSRRCRQKDVGHELPGSQDDSELTMHCQYTLVHDPGTHLRQKKLNHSPFVDEGSKITKISLCVHLPTLARCILLVYCIDGSLVLQYRSGFL